MLILYQTDKFSSSLTILIFVFNAVSLFEPEDPEVFMGKMKVAVHLTQGIEAHVTVFTEIDLLCSARSLFFLFVTEVCCLDVDVHVPIAGEGLVAPREGAREGFVF